MRLKIKFVLTTSISLLFFASGFAAERVISSPHRGVLNSRMIMGENTSLLVKGMGGACLGISRLVDSPPCNPAFVILEKEPRLLASFALSNGYSNLDKARVLFEKKIDATTVEDLLRGVQPLDIELSGAVTFFSSALNARYSPAHTQLHSLMVGDLNPFVELWAYHAESLSLQWGQSLFLPNLMFGVQVDFVKAEVINREFRLLELVTEEGRRYLDPLKLNYIDIKPGFAVTLNSWTLSVLGTQLNTPKSETLNLYGPELQSGVAYTLWNDIEIGKLDFALDYKQQFSQFGVKYEYGVLSAVAGISEYGSSLGLFFFIKKMFSGILYSNTALPWKKNDSVSTVYTQFGIQL